MLQALDQMSDETLLETLKKNVTEAQSAVLAAATPDPFDVYRNVREIFKRVAIDGLDEHELFRPVAEAMAKLKENDISNDKVIAKALADVFNDEPNNPWREVVNGKKVDPQQYGKPRAPL